MDRKRFLIIILICIILSACSRSIGGGGYFSDRSISFTINNRIYGDKALYADNHITTVVKNATVLLVGQVRTVQYKQQAEDIAKSVNGIRSLYNEITVGRPTSIGQQFRDASITTELELKLLSAENLNSNAIKVVTENNVVYLLGNIDYQQAQQATEIARRINGVEKVVNVFEKLETKEEKL